MGYILDEAVARRLALLALLDRVPVTLCHNDVHPANFLEPAGDGGLVLVDWAYVGVGPMGADAGNLAVDAGFDFWLHADLLREMSATHLVDAYLAGLADVGWAGDPELARAGFYGVIAVKYPWTLGALLDAAAEVGEGRAASVNGRLFEEAWRGWRETVRQVAGASKIALELADRQLDGR